MFNKIQKKQQTKEIYQSIPSFQIPDINGRIVSEDLLKNFRTVMFLYFNPDCDLCREEKSCLKIFR